MVDRNKFLSFSEFKKRFDIKSNFLVFYGLISALKLLKSTEEDQLPPKGNHDNSFDVFWELKNPTE